MDNLYVYTPVKNKKAFVTIAEGESIDLYANI